jgi:hypothetical protein
MRFEKKKDMATNISGEHAVPSALGRNPPQNGPHDGRIARPIGSGGKA